VFISKKRRVQRQLAQAAEQGFLRDIKHNPRRFWTAYKSAPAQPPFQDMEALTAHWQGLYAVPNSGGLRECASSVPELMRGLERDWQGFWTTGC
jgi:hypothetical protein